MAAYGHVQELDRALAPSEFGAERHHHRVLCRRSAAAGLASALVVALGLVTLGSATGARPAWPANRGAADPAIEGALRSRGERGIARSSLLDTTVLEKYPVADASPAPGPTPLKCEDAEPQAPRDLSSSAEGKMIPKAATLDKAQVEYLPLVNVHFHLGGEHMSEEYSDDSLSKAYDGAGSGDRALLGGEYNDVRPGWMCSTSDLTEDQLAPYEFKYCRGKTEVGKSYEVHYVHSSAGYDKEDIEGMDLDLLDDGLGTAAGGRGQLNPMIAVQGQIYQIVQGAAEIEDMLHSWTVEDTSNAVMYPGSTTGQSVNNEICSPYTVTWHVDKGCHRVSPETFDNMCKMMQEEYGLEHDLYPHGSRTPVDPAYVVTSEYVQPLA